MMDGRRIAVAAVAAILTFAPPVVAQRTTRHVFVSTLDENGTVVPNLRPADFSITEGGAPREVTRATTDVPMRVLLMVESTSAVGASLTRFRSALAGFLEALDPEIEVGFITTGGQLKIRVPPGTDRQALRAQIQAFSSESGGNSMIEAVLEADKRLFKDTPQRWPVFVLVTTDLGSGRSDPPFDRYNRFVGDYVARGGSAHAVIIQGASPGILSTIVENMVHNTGGSLETIGISSALPDKLRNLGRRISEDRIAMTGRYELEYASDSKAAAGAAVEVHVIREGVRVRVSHRRPF
jgi:hypothetical protein